MSSLFSSQALCSSSVTGAGGNNNGRRYVQVCAKKLKVFALANRDEKARACAQEIANLKKRIETAERLREYARRSSFLVKHSGEFPNVEEEKKLCKEAEEKRILILMQLRTKLAAEEKMLVQLTKKD